MHKNLPKPLESASSAGFSLFSLRPLPFAAMSKLNVDDATLAVVGEALPATDPFLKEKDRAEKLRQSVINAVGNAEYHRLGGLLGGLAALPITNRLLWETGVGHLVADKTLWALSADETVVTRASKLSEAWKAEWARSPQIRKSETHKKAVHPFASLKAARFSEVVQCLCVQTNELLDSAEPSTVKAVAVALALNGFTHTEHLVGVQEKEVEIITRVPGCIALVKRLIVAVSARSAVKRRRTAAALVESQALAVIPSTSSSSSAPPAILPTEASQPASSSAQALGARVRDMDVDEVHSTIDKAIHAWGVPTEGKQSGPASTIEKLAAARDKGMPVCDLLAAKAATLRLESKRKSLTHVATGLSAILCFRMLHSYYSDINM